MPAAPPVISGPFVVPAHSGEPFAHSSGPRNAKIAFVGEAWGEQEAFIQRPFVGESGQELTRILKEAGLDRSECFLTNVLAFQPPNNEIESLCLSKKAAGDSYPLSALKQGKYLDPQYLPELDRLRTELETVRPNLIVALGNTACWALLGSGKISAVRGVTTTGPLCLGMKVLPTYHPAAVLYQWSFRPIVIVDLLKARREMEFPEIRRPVRKITVSPTMEEIREWAIRSHVALAVDTETKRGQLRTVQFARSPYEALVIPFWIGAGDYWPTLETELEAWSWVKYLLSLPCPKIFQNGLYDLQFFLRYGIKPVNCLHDTMLLHHALYPELLKGLGFLGSYLTDESSWKLMRGRSDMMKSDE